MHDGVKYLTNGKRTLVRANQVNGHTSWTSDQDSLALWYDKAITDWKIGGLKYLGTSTGGIVTANDNPKDCPWSNQNQDKWKYYDGSSWKYLKKSQFTVRCSEVNSQCIKKTWLWDGDEDCSNGEDELIRSNHDGWIGFENQCQTNCDGGPDCFISEKDSNIVMRGALNTNEKFKLVAYYRGKNEPIQDGDTVLLYYEDDKWLSCECGGYCAIKGCPGDRDNPNLSGCEWEGFTIHNYGVDGPIKHDQTVYLKRKGCSNKPYLTGKHGKWVETTHNLGSCEKWTLKKAK